ncbi:adenylyltransferase/cytidyltransferase family protein [Mucilaginibacter daejeonensis]|uniref:adenylyltransferase/cytidyltransferase family protein n=1 Tax=Mucilaginibacter daejeonensis TaxID=398049 RepID=UPI001D17AB6D|nr:adenylyltransferase/cytidyltransferase family protein [Mucilaginibacter daejeonensis]UEG52008.1 adenylyltransferase/cytidyltransferase family protein [Mucilaginibacter daejeonensis]
MNTIADIHALLKPTVEVPDEVLQRYQEPHRFYHTLDHLADLLLQIRNSDHAGNKVLMLAAVYHDVIYDPRSATNEEDSARYFDDHYEADTTLKQEVTQLILDTKTHQPQNELSAVFCRFDLNILEQPLDQLITYEHQIFKEFQFVDHSVYQAKRIEVLRQLSREVDNPHLDSLITYVQTRQPQIALYPGSFNPFHKGHYNILQKAEQIFDKVIIARGINREKAASTYELPKALELRQVVTYDGLLTDHVNTLEYPVTVIRGLRNSTDLQYELNQYRYLQDLSGNSLRIVSIFCDREFEHISSTGIRQLEAYGKADDYLM